MRQEKRPGHLRELGRSTRLLLQASSAITKLYAKKSSCRRKRGVREQKGPRPNPLRIRPVGCRNGLQKKKTVRKGGNAGELGTILGGPPQTGECSERGEETRSRTFFRRTKTAHQSGQRKGNQKSPKRRGGRIGTRLGFEHRRTSVHTKELVLNETWVEREAMGQVTEGRREGDLQARAKPKEGREGKGTKLVYRTPSSLEKKHSLYTKGRNQRSQEPK